MDDGTPLARVLINQGVLVGIKVDKGVARSPMTLPRTPRMFARPARGPLASPGYSRLSV